MVLQAWSCIFSVSNVLVHQKGWLPPFSQPSLSSLTALWRFPNHNTIHECVHTVLSPSYHIFTALSHRHLITQSWGSREDSNALPQFSQAKSVDLFCIPICCTTLYQRHFCCIVTASFPPSTTMCSPKSGTRSIVQPSVPELCSVWHTVSV